MCLHFMAYDNQTQYDLIYLLQIISTVDHCLVFKNNLKYLYGSKCSGLFEIKTCNNYKHFSN